MKNVKKYPGITDEDAAKLAATKLIDSTHHGAMWYRIGAVRCFTGGKKIEPVLECHLQKVGIQTIHIMLYYYIIYLYVLMYERY